MQRQTGSCWHVGSETSCARWWQYGHNNKDAGGCVAVRETQGDTHSTAYIGEGEHVNGAHTTAAAPAGVEWCGNSVSE